VKRLGSTLAAAAVILLLAGCAAPNNSNLTFLAESSALCADPSLTDAIIGVGIEVHGSQSATIDQVSLDGTPVSAADTVWLLDAFPANRATAYPPSAVAGWQTRADVTTSDASELKVSPGSHTLVVRLQRGQSGPDTVVKEVEVAYSLGGHDGTAASSTVLGFGTAGDHVCE
jgi:hypothetical protein